MFPPPEAHPAPFPRLGAIVAAGVVLAGVAAGLYTYLGPVHFASLVTILVALWIVMSMGVHVLDFLLQLFDMLADVGTRYLDRKRAKRKP